MYTYFEYEYTSEHAVKQNYNSTTIPIHTHLNTCSRRKRATPEVTNTIPGTPLSVSFVILEETTILEVTDAILGTCWALATIPVASLFILEEAQTPEVTNMISGTHWALNVIPIA